LPIAVERFVSWISHRPSTQPAPPVLLVNYSIVDNTATFVDTQTSRAVRIVPSANTRKRAKDYAPEAQSRWEAYLLGYQRMPDAELLDIKQVALTVSLEKILSKDGYRVNCDHCGEEIINEREVIRDGLTLCRACAGERYYQPVEDTLTFPAGILLDQIKV
jgi:formylmethanofuran dehydrogenase subunit E